MELKINEKEEEADTEFFPIEICRVISVTREVLEREKYVEEAALEFYLMVSSIDYSSEEDLYFSNEDDTDLNIASVVPHLGSDTEEDEVVSIKYKKICQSTARRKEKEEDSDPDYAYESTYMNISQQSCNPRRKREYQIRANKIQLRLILKLPNQLILKFSQRNIKQPREDAKLAKLQNHRGLGLGFKAESAIFALNCSGMFLGSLQIRISPSKTPVRPRIPRAASH
ncbi:hypothetical protein M5K25_003445 [Dendrobium thyrsiflorum]|uniref:Uncharacterized protein n=1 Tax=Dendrobium thyrsiflorum TaxID=117978 RepID=A0ABD0VJD4_DENTH